MRCWLCPRSISPADAPKRVEWRRPADTVTTVLVMFGQDNTPLSQARGILVKAAHGKCYHSWRKRVPIGGESQEDHVVHEDHGHSG